MKRSAAVLLLAALSLLLVPAALRAAGERRADNTIIKSHYFKFNNQKYFRDSAEDQKLGSYGDKEDPIGALGYLAVVNHISPTSIASYADVAVAGPYGIEWSRYKESDIVGAVGVNYFALGGTLKFGASKGKLDSGKMKVLKISITLGNMKNLLNKHAPAALDYLADKGAQGRAVHQLWVILDGELSTHFTNRTSLTVGGSSVTKSVSISAGWSGHGTQTISLAPGSTFAYLLVKVKKWGKHRDSIDELETDAKGTS